MSELYGPLGLILLVLVYFLGLLTGLVISRRIEKQRPQVTRMTKEDIERAFAPTNKIPRDKSSPRQ